MNRRTTSIAYLVILAVAVIVLVVRFTGLFGSAGAGNGSIDFGAGYTTDFQIERPHNRFGPTDTLAYVAHLTASAGSAPLTWSILRQTGRGVDTTVHTQLVQLHRKDDYTVANTIPVPELRAFGVTAPGAYRMRLSTGGTTLAQGTFTLTR